MTESADVQQENLWQEKDNFFYLIAENVPALIAYVDAEDMRYRFVNRHYEDFFEKPRETIIGRQVREIIGEKNYMFALPYIEAALSGKATSYENIFIVSQVESWMKVNYVPDVDKSGAVKGIFVLNVDITEGKLAEKALQESEQKFKDLSEKSIAGIYLVQDGIFKYVNLNLARTLGYEIDEMIDKIAVKDIVFPEDWPLVEENVRKRISGEIGSIHYEFRVTTKNKEVRNIEVYSSRTTYLGKPAIIGTHLDITERKQAEKELRISEAKFKEIFETIEDLYYETDSEGIIKTLSPSLHRLTGWNKEDLIGKPTTSFYVDPNDRERMLLKLSEKGYIHDYEVLLRGKDGEERLASLSARLIIDDNGQQIGIRGLLRDINERKRAEEELRKSERRLRQVIDLVPHFIFAKDRAGRFILVNKSVADAYGVTVEELTGKTDGDFNPNKDEVDHFLRDDLLVMDSGQPKEIPEEYITDSKGSIRILQTIKIPFTLSLTGDDAVLGVSTDITEHKRVEKAVIHSEEQFRKMFEESPIGMAMTGDDLIFVRANAAFCKMLGYTEQELTCITFKDITHPEHIADDVLHVNDLISGEIPIYRTEKRYIRKDKEIVWASVTVNIMHDRDDKFLYCLATVEDITQRKQSEEEKARLESELRQAQKMEAIGTLAGGVAHDFNNILTAINGFGTLLLTAMEESSPLRRYVNQIIASSRKAANLTRSLLTFSRKQPITLTPISINNCIKETEKLLKRLLTEDIELSTSFAPEDIIIMADVTQIDQILFNLATNARDAMKKGGELNIEIKPFDMDNRFKEHHGFGFPGRYALLTVTDTGHGMDESTKEKMFDPFFTTKELGKGTGLGLSTVYGIVKQHNGYIDVSSKPGLGTTFSVYLPAIEIAAAEEEKIFPHAIKGGYETILIAEDDTDVRLFMKETLSYHGYTVFEATDGQDAIDKFKEYMNFDLVILDSVMPKKNGRETYDDIRVMKPFTKALFMSGYTRDIVIDKGVEEGKVDFIAKPFSQDELIKKVRDVLDK